MTRTEHLLFKLAEEAAEVAQRASKAARFGMMEVQPGRAINNAERIILELNDLYTVVEMLSLCDIRRGHMDEHRAKIEKFLEYSREQGTLT